MPIYEYACMECESHFEELVRTSEQAGHETACSAFLTSSSKCDSHSMHAYS